MKVAMLALMLLVASVIVLIFANTLNSWVLGGLIGGLGALLISIPISLILFVSLARRHDERLFAQIAEQEEAALQAAEEYEYVDAYEAEAYVVAEDDEQYYYEEGAYYEDGYQQYNDPRLNRMPEARRLPAPGQGYASPAYTTDRRSPDQYQRYRQTTRQLYPAAEEEWEQAARLRQPVQPSRAFQSRQDKRGTGHQRQARTPQTTRSLRAMQHSAALRAARREAEQDQFDESGITISPRGATTPRRLPSQSNRLYRNEQESPATRTDNLRRSMMRGPLNGNDGPQAGLSADPQIGDMRTDPLRGYNPETGPMRFNPETGKIVRNPRLEEEYAAEDWTDALNNPVVRRAPYLYADDPLSEHFAQQVEKPIARRSSRYLQPLEEE